VPPSIIKSLLCKSHGNSILFRQHRKQNDKWNLLSSIICQHCKDRSFQHSYRNSNSVHTHTQIGNFRTRNRVINISMDAQIRGNGNPPQTYSNRYKLPKPKDKCYTTISVDMLKNKMPMVSVMPSLNSIKLKKLTEPIMQDANTQSKWRFSMKCNPAMRRLHKYSLAIRRPINKEPPRRFKKPSIPILLRATTRSMQKLLLKETPQSSQTQNMDYFFDRTNLSPWDDPSMSPELNL